MQKIIIASKNPVKINATLKGFQEMFPNEVFEIEGVSVASGVSEQPKSDSETFEGAKTRAENASREVAVADYWVGIEGGIEETKNGMEAFAWTVVKSTSGKIGKGRSCTFFLPPKVAELINQGMELGDADDVVFGRTNSKQQNGAVGLLTDNAITRTDYYSLMVMLALIPFKNESLYPQAIVIDALRESIV